LKNKYEIRGSVTDIYLNSKKHGIQKTLISTEHLPKVIEFPYSWFPYLDATINDFYVRGNLKGKIVFLHRWITDCPDGMQVDHINHKTLDNTVSNLMVVTQSQNQRNRIRLPKSNSSGVMGVNWCKRTDKWNAQFRINNRIIWVGRFDDIEVAEKEITKTKKIYYEKGI